MYQVAQTITMTTAKVALDAGLKAISEGQDAFDLAQLTEVDSAAVATLLIWQRSAAACGRTLVFHYLPQTLQTLAKLYGADALLTPAHPVHRHPG